jgi:Ala-tRNA(Pro) deacylase
MAIPKKVINFLEKSKVRYELIKHRTVYTAFDKAATLRVKPKIIGKMLIVRLDKNPALVLIPANKNLDKQKLKKLAKIKNIDFIKEAWMKKNLKGIKIGAVPPFGNLWGLRTFLDRGLTQNPEIIINSGDYNFSIKISPAVLKKITPDLIIGNFSQTRK